MRKTELGGLPGLDALPRNELRALARAGKEVTHDAGTTVIKQGAGAAALHVLVEGRVQVVLDGRPVSEFGPGAIFGEMAFLDRAARSASIVATTPVRLHAVSAWSVESLMNQAPALRALIEHQAVARKTEAGDQPIG